MPKTPEKRAHLLRARGNPRNSSRNGRVKAAFREVYENEPKIVAHTRRKFGAKRAKSQKVAIALNKARRAGARIPS